MDSALRAILHKNGVGEAVTKRMTEANCLNVGHFANWVDSRVELHDAFLKGTADDKDTAQLARLKTSWREAEAAYSKKLKRSSEGVREEALDEPLGAPTQATIETNFTTAYGWPVLPPDSIGTDTLLGRFYREFQAGKPTMFPVSKVKSLKATQATVAAA